MKDFKTAAEQFISTPAQGPESKGVPGNETQPPKEQETTSLKGKDGRKARRKKDIEKLPPNLAEIAKLLPNGFRLDRALIETKTARVQLVMQPSLRERAKAAAAYRDVSLNEFAHEAIRQAVEKVEAERKKLEKLKQKGEEDHGADV